MKRYIRLDSVEATLKSASYANVLRRIKDNLEKQGLNCQINEKHKCVDVFDESGQIIGQSYPRKSRTTPVTKSYFQYVGPGQGDYKKYTKNSFYEKYTEEDPYCKYIVFTNDPADERCPATKPF